MFRRRSWRRGSRSGRIGGRICRGCAGGGRRSSRRSLVRNYLGTFLQFVLTVRDDKFSGLQTIAHAYSATSGLSNRDVMNFARGNFRRVVSIKRFDSELCGAFVKLVENLRKLILWKRKDDRYGLKLR